MTRWMLQVAKNKISERIDRARSEGPQVVTRRGRDTAVVLSIEDFQALSASAGTDLVEQFGRDRETGRDVEL